MLAIFLALIDEPSDKEKFIEIYHKYKHKMFRKANSMLKNSCLAEEAVQESFFRIAKNIKKVSFPICGRTTSFIVIVVKNVCRDIHKKENVKNTVHYDEDKENEAQDNSFPDIETIISEIGFKQVVNAVSAIDDIYGDVLKLRFLYGYNSKEISEILNISQSAVSMRILRGKRLLKEKLEENGYVFK